MVTNQEVNQTYEPTLISTYVFIWIQFLPQQDPSEGQLIL